MNTISLPSGWARVLLSDVVRMSGDRVLPSDAGEANYIGLEHIERDTHRLSGVGRASDASSMKTRFQTGDLLYGRLRPNLNKVVIAPFDGVCSTDIIVFQPTPLLQTRYLLEVLSDSAFLSFAQAHAKGVNLPRISTSSLLSYAIDLPPLKEQSRIIDALYARYKPIRNIEDAISLIESRLELMPAKVFRSAFDGAMTFNWRLTQENADVIGEASDLANEAKEELNSSVTQKRWPIRRVDQAGEVKTGRQRAPKNHYGPNMRPYLRVANVLEDQIRLDDVMSMNFTPKEAEIYQLVFGDILLNEGQSLELVGRPAMFRGELEGLCFTNSLIRFRSAEDVEPEFALLVFRHYFQSGVFSEIAKITTNLAHLGTSRFAALPFPVPSRDEQREIIDLASQYLQAVKSIEHRLSNVLKLCRALVYSLRQDGLTGKLLPQEEGEESAIEALARVPADALMSVKRVPRSNHERKSEMKNIISVREAIIRSQSSLSGQELFDAAGYPDDASSDLIEQFFLDLRGQLVAGNLTRKEVGSEDRYVLAPSGINP